MATKRRHKKSDHSHHGNVQAYLQAALSISQLLKMYAFYAETHGFDPHILANGLQALTFEIQAALNLVVDEDYNQKQLTNFGNRLTSGNGK